MHLPRSFFAPLSMVAIAMLLLRVIPVARGFSQEITAMPLRVCLLLNFSSCEMAYDLSGCVVL